MRLQFIHFRLCILLALLGICAAAGPETRPAGPIVDNGPGSSVLDGPSVFSAGARGGAVHEGTQKVQPFGIDNADGVVFVCGGGDSMAETLAFLKVSVADAIDSLAPTQHFGIIFYHGQQVESASKDDLMLRAIPDDKKTASEFLLKVKDGGNETALPAIKAAFKSKPQRIVLISTGELRDQADITKWLAENDKDKRIRINTVAWGKTTSDGADALREIAGQTGGTFQIGLNHPPAPEHSIAMFGTPGDGIGPRGPVFGYGGNARLIVFVCDVTVPIMLQKPTVLKDELNKTVIGLRPIQSFDIIFAGKDKPVMFAAGLVSATPEHKRQTATFLEDEVKLTPKTDPMPAIEAALKLRPQLIYLLTDSDFPDNDVVAKKIAELNKGNRMKVNTIYLRRDKETPEVVEALKKIAGENQGKFRFASADGTE